MTLFDFLDTLPGWLQIISMALLGIVLTFTISGICSLNKLGDISRTLDEISSTLKKEKK